MGKLGKRIKENLNGINENWKEYIKNYQPYTFVGQYIKNSIVGVEEGQPAAPCPTIAERIAPYCPDVTGTMI